MRAEDRNGDGQLWLAALACGMAVAALVLQYVLLVRLTLIDIGPVRATVRFFSFFTILSNILVALATGCVFANDHSRMAVFFRRPSVRGGVALYIGITGTIYVSILRHLWNPQGWQWWADTSLHYVVPALYLTWWLAGVRHGALLWRGIARWLLFPLVYLAWCFLRGTWAHEYPYPFIDVAQLGWIAVLRNSAGILALFVAFGAALIAVDRLLGKPRAL